MKKFFALFLIAAALPFNTFVFAQNLDSLILTSAEVSPGDTADIQLSLRNQSFAVGGFRVEIIIPDSSRAKFVAIERGIDVQYFGYFNLGPFTDGTAGITGIASMPPIPADPLPIGYHELAVIRIAIDDSITGRLEIPVIFVGDDEFANVISDSSGYITLQPESVDGLITVQWITDIDETGEVPDIFELKGNFPNPFNASTTIEFSLAEAGYIELEVYDIQGRLVKTLASGYFGSGSHSVVWDGSSRAGHSLASGVYFYRLVHNNSIATGRMNLIK